MQETAKLTLNKNGVEQTLEGLGGDLLQRGAVLHPGVVDEDVEGPLVLLEAVRGILLLEQDFVWRQRHARRGSRITGLGHEGVGREEAIAADARCVSFR